MTFPDLTASSTWALDPDVVFLNHGSFGACPRRVLEEQERLRRQLECEPVRFYVRELESLLDRARTELAVFVGADPEGLAFVNNATTGVNTVLASFPFEPGDEVIVTDHEYDACANAARYWTARAGAEVAVAAVRFPIRSPHEVSEAVLEAITPRTRLVLIDHVTSQTGLVFPLAELVSDLEQKGIAVLVDGAHAPGMLDLDLTELGASFYTGNCHKWLCAPKGAAFLAVREDWRPRVRPLVISHGASVPDGPKSRFRLEFDWVGTDDPTPFLSIPTALETIGSLIDGGWPEVRARNRALVLHGRDVLCSRLGVEPPSPDSMIGSLAAIPLPDGVSETISSPLYKDPIQDDLLFQHGIEVPVIPWPAPPRRLIRISAQLYNRVEQYELLTEALGGVLGLHESR